MRTFFTMVGVVTLVAIAGAQEPAPSGQQTLQQVKDLYTQAAYEEALGALGDLTGTESITEAARYRAACLLALGRDEDARKTVAEIVDTHPEYRPDPAETSPRVVDLFRAARLARVPVAARGMYSDAKAAMDRQELDGAIQRFETLIRLIDEPEFAADATLGELKMLAAGFLELTRARAAAATKPEAPVAPLADPPAATPADSPAATPADSPAAEPAGPPAAAPATSRRITPAVAITQEVPAWTPPEPWTRWEFKGAVRVRIGADGKVVSAVIASSVHPVYDARLLAAAREWRYEPMRQDGTPIASDLTVQIVLKPR